MDAANEYEPKAKILTKQGLKQAGITNPSSEWKYTLGATKQPNYNAKSKFKKGDLVKVKGKSWVMVVDKISYVAPFGVQYFLENDIRGTRNGNAGSYFENEIEKINNSKVGSTLKLKANEKRLGATPKDAKTKSKNYHKDTKSHNVNIRVMSGIGSIDYLHKEILETIRLIELYERGIQGNNEYLKVITSTFEKKKVRNQTAFFKSKLAYYKKALIQLKKLYNKK